MSVIYITEQTNKIGKNKIVNKFGIVKESLISSVLSDLFTFGSLLTSFWINYQYIHSRLLSVFLLLGYIFSVNKNTKYISKEEFLKKVNEFVEG